MRAALPHLRLLTLPVDKLHFFSIYLSAEEKTSLAVQLLFKKGSSSQSPLPSTLNSSTTPREQSVYLELGSCWLEIIPDDFIITDHFKMGGQPLNKIRSKGGQREVFTLDLIKIKRDMCLTGIEILTQANNCPQFKQAKGKNLKG